MEVWRAGAGDRVRLPCWPGEVDITDAEGTADGSFFNRLHWQAGTASGSLVLPDGLDIELLATAEPGKQPFVTRPGIEPEAGG